MSEPLVLAVEETLTIDNMRAWASSFPADQVLGYTSRSSDCPIARFLRARLQQGVQVGRGMWGTVPGPALLGNWYELPSWASQFVWVIDTCFKDEVTAEEVLAVLDSVEHTPKRVEYGVSPVVTTLLEEKAEEKVLVLA